MGGQSVVKQESYRNAKKALPLVLHEVNYGCTLFQRDLKHGFSRQSFIKVFTEKGMY